jgi:glucose-6-phosphate isomerase
MSDKITLDYSYAYPFINDSDIENYKNEAFNALDTLVNKSGKGNDFLGWLDLPKKALESIETKEILEIADHIHKKADLVICIGIGGSYLGAKAVTEALLHPFHNSLKKKERKAPKIYFAGHNISGSWLEAILDEIDNSDKVYVNVISKSGTTTEPGVAFRSIKGMMEKKYGKRKAAKHIIATTDAKKGALKELATKEGYKTFVIPDDVGGRFSVLTPVGLLPIASVGIDIKKLLNGALEASKYTAVKDIETNPALVYAIIRNLLLKKGKSTEILVNYEPALHYFSEWWKQLYGESEGKEGKGIYPASVDFTTDLHSMGQWIQEGQRIIFETVIDIVERTSNLKVPSFSKDIDGLEFLAHKTYFDINKKAFEGTILAHYEGKVPNLVFKLPKLDAYNLGQLIHIFEFACGISGYLLGVNPFDQPGVEAYKKNMFALLNKPGEANDKIRASISEKLKNIPSGKTTK